MSEQSPVEPEVVKKKRGRKPKNVPPQQPPVTDNVDMIHEEAVSEVMPQIVQIRKSDQTEYTEKNYETVFCDYTPDVNVPNAYDKDDSFSTIPSVVEEDPFKQSVDFMAEEGATANEWACQTDTYCFWCSHGFTCVPVGIPLKLLDGKFYCHGNFCSFECAAAYNYNSNDNTSVFEKQNLLNLLASKFGVETPVRCAKPRETLKIFGGDMDINEFRKHMDNTIYFSNKYPIVSVGEQIEELHDSFSTQSSETFTIKKSSVPKQKTMTDFV